MLKYKYNLKRKFPCYLLARAMKKLSFKQQNLLNFVFFLFSGQLLKMLIFVLTVNKICSGITFEINNETHNEVLLETR